MNLEFFTISLLNGLSYGLLLFMLSSGLTLIFSMMGVLNFAHASFYMVGAYIAYSTSQVIGFWWSLLVAPLLVFAGVVLGQEMSLVFRPFEVVALSLATVVTAIITLDGESHWFEGVQLLAVYAMVAVGAFFLN